MKNITRSASHNFIDLTGKKFGSFLILRRDKNHAPGIVSWICKCECGEIKSIRGGNLKNGKCSCAKCGDEIGMGNRSHGMSDSPTYISWSRMKNRCQNKNDDSYYKYGGRGIKVCKRWMKFENFLEDMGERPEGMSIDRIEGDKGYEPGNCRWATAVEQARNTRRNRLITYNGESKSIVEWSELTGIPQDTLRGRLNMGWSHIETIETPLRKDSRRTK